MIGAIVRSSSAFVQFFSGWTRAGAAMASESAALWRSGQLPGVVGERLLTYRYDRYARLRGSALRSVKHLPETGTGAG